jgi:hypothetical protein
LNSCADILPSDREHLPADHKWWMLFNRARRERSAISHINDPAVQRQKKQLALRFFKAVRFIWSGQSQYGPVSRLCDFWDRVTQAGPVHGQNDAAAVSQPASPSIH